MIQFYTTPLLDRTRDITPVLEDDITQMREELQTQGIYEQG